MLARYRAILAVPSARGLVTASLFGRLGIAFDLPLVLTLQQATGSFATAGIALGAFAVAAAVTAPLRGRLVDRFGTRRTLPPLAVMAALPLLGVALLAGSVPAAVLVALSGLSGAAAPPGVATMRLEWQRLLGSQDPRRATAYAFESAAQTAVFVAGPLLAAAVIALAGARVALGASAAVLLIGTLTFAAVARAVPAGPRTTGTRSAVRLPGVRTLIAVTILADLALGAIDVIVPAVADASGRPEAAGLLLAAFAIGAVAGALAFGARRWPGSPAAQLTAILLAGAAAFALLALPASVLALGGLLVLAGAPGAALWAATSVALDAAGRGSGPVEAFTWLSTANGVGIAAGSVLGGAVVEASGSGPAFLLAASGPAAAAVLLLARRRTLGSPPGAALAS